MAVRQSTAHGYDSDLPATGLITSHPSSLSFLLYSPRQHSPQLFVGILDLADSLLVDVALHP